MKNQDNIKIEIIKEGISTTPHTCDWIPQFNDKTPEDILEVKQICRICGRIEKETRKLDMSTYEDVSKKFHKEVI